METRLATRKGQERRLCREARERHGTDREVLGNDYMW